MKTPLRLAIVVLLMVAGSLSLNQASAQMMHFTLNIVIETEDGSDIPEGQVCVSGEVDPICMDTGGNPSGREFSFTGLADGPHDVTINAGDYLEIVDTVTLTEDITTVTYTLQKEQTPPTTEPTAEPTTDVLPNTGTGATVDSEGSSAVSLLSMSAVLLVMASLVLMLRRRASL